MIKYHLGTIKNKNKRFILVEKTHKTLFKRMFE